MSLFQSVAEWWRGAPSPAPDPQPQNRIAEEAFWQDILACGKTTSGEMVNWATSLGEPTALRCALVIADGVSTVPCKLMRKDPATGARMDATDHPLYWLFKRSPSPMQNSLEFRETMALHCVFTGNAFAYKNVVRKQVKELIVIPPNAVSMKQLPDYTLEYTVHAPDGTSEVVPQDLLWHLRGPSWNGYAGLDIVHLLRNTLGLSMAAERAHASRFGNGVQTSGMFSTDSVLDEAQHKRLTGWIKRNFSGPDNSGNALLLDRGMKYTQLEMSGVDAEHVSTRELQIQQVCTGFGVKPIMIGHADKTATYASAEQMFLAHAVHTIRPWHRRFEASMNASLLTEDEFRAGYYFKFFDTELLRGAARDRADYFMKLYNMGAISGNEVSELEDMEGVPGGEQRFRPANLVPLNEETNQQTINAPGAGPGGTQNQPNDPNAPVNKYMNVGRVLSSENEGLIRNAAGNLDTVLTKLDAQQPEDHSE